MKIYKKNGYVLAFTIFMMTILLVLAASIHTYINSELLTVRLNLESSQAYNIAIAGVYNAIKNIKSDYDYSGTGSGGTSFGLGKYVVTVPKTSSGMNLKSWQIVSTGIIGSTERTVTVWAQLQSFGDYLYMTDVEQMTGGNVIWFSDGEVMDGNSHTNGYYSIQGNPQFGSDVTSANSNDSYYIESERKYTQTGIPDPYDPAYFYHYYNNGGKYSTNAPVAYNSSAEFQFSGAQSEIELPSTNDVKDYAKSVANLEIIGSPTIVFNSNGTVTITNAGSIKTDLTKVGTDDTYQIPSDGITIYASGNTTVSGVVSGKATVFANGHIYINNDLVYNNDNTDVLGLVATSHIITTKTSTGDLNIDALIMALNTSFYADDYDEGSYKGKLNLYGGLIQKKRGPVGTFNGYTGEYTTGYKKNYHYDPKLSGYPPPNFPATGQINIISLSDSAAFGH